MHRSIIYFATCFSHPRDNATFATRLGLGRDKRPEKSRKGEHKRALLIFAHAVSTAGHLWNNASDDKNSSRTRKSSCFPPRGSPLPLFADFFLPVKTGSDDRDRPRARRATSAARPGARCCPYTGRPYAHKGAPGRGVDRARGAEAEIAARSDMG